MDRLLRVALGTLIRAGHLRVTTAAGSTFTLGDGTGTPVTIRFTSRATELGLLLDPELKLGEAYMDGGIVVEQGSIADVLAIALGQSPDRKPPAWARLPWLIRYVNRRQQQFNPRRRARRNVARHYDLDGQLYALFLDADRQYSCGYFESADQSLDDAQLAKKRHLAAKLLVAPSQRVLDIGCGWGGLALYLAELCGARVTGITLSEQQHALARVRAAEKGLSGRIDIPSAGLPGRRGTVRPHRLGGHVRARGGRLLRCLLPQVSRIARRQRRHAAAFHRPLRRPERHQSVDREIHLPRRLYPRPVGGASGGRARGAAGHRHRDPETALCRDAQGLARSASSPTARRSSVSTTTVSYECGNSTWRHRRWLSANRR